MVSNTTMTPWNPTTHEDYNKLKGMKVFAEDGQEVGEVKEIFHPNMEMPEARGKHYMLVSPGLLDNWFGGLEEAYLPETAIAGFTSDGVVLSVTKDELKSQSLNEPTDIDSYRRSW
jgi:hypothetical protein